MVIDKKEKRNNFSILQKAALFTWAAGLALFLQNQDAGLNHYNFLQQVNDSFITKLHFD